MNEVNYLCPDMDNPASISNFIKNTESNIFTGTNVDGEDRKVS